MQRDDFLDENRLSPRDVLDRLARHRVGQEADEVTGVASFHRHADLAVRLEATDSRPMARARIDHHERTALNINLHATRRSDAHERIIYRSLQRSAVDDQFDRIVEDMRCGFGQMFAVLNPALTHDIEKQDATLPCIHQVFEGG